MFQFVVVWIVRLDKNNMFLRADNQNFGALFEIDSGQEVARVRTGGPMQGVVFPSPGWGRDLYWSSMGRLARVFVQ